MCLSCLGRGRRIAGPAFSGSSSPQDRLQQTSGRWAVPGGRWGGRFRRAGRPVAVAAAAWRPAWSWASRRRWGRRAPGGCAAPTSPARSGGGRRGWARPGCRAPPSCAVGAASSPAPSCCSCTRRCPTAPTPSTARSSSSPAAAPPATASRARGGPSAVRRGAASEEGARTSGRLPADCPLSPAVFRNQLPRQNDTYSAEPPPEEPPPDPAAAAAPPCRLRGGAALCRVCGCLGPRACGRCRRAAYCGPEHQALDWRRGHRRACGLLAAGGACRGGGPVCRRLRWLSAVVARCAGGTLLGKERCRCEAGSPCSLSCLLVSGARACGERRKGGRVFLPCFRIRKATILFRRYIYLVCHKKVGSGRLIYLRCTFSLFKRPFCLMLLKKERV